MLDLVGNTEERFSCAAAHIRKVIVDMVRPIKTPVVETAETYYYLVQLSTTVTYCLWSARFSEVKAFFYKEIRYDKYGRSRGSHNQLIL